MLKPIVTLLALALAACATQLGLRDKADLRRQMFLQMVFSPDYDSRRLDFLAKWTSPLRISIKGVDGAAHKSIITAQAKTLEDLTGLNISFAGVTTPANVTIYFAQAQAMDELAGSHIRNRERMQASLLAAGCHFIIDKDSSYSITGAIIFIRTGENITTVKSCVSRVLTKTLGFSNISELIQPSMFNANYPLKHPTALDEKFIRALYAPKLTPGMPRKQVLQELETLLQ